MAKATKIYKDITINLEMTSEEAAALFVVLWHIGGSPTTSPRKYIDAILTKLYELGVDVRYDENKLISALERAMYFNDNTLNQFNEEVVSEQSK